MSDEKQAVSQKIVKFILFSRWSYFIIASLFLLSLLFRWLLPYWQIVPAVLSIFWFICFILTFNVPMTKRMARSFVFWYKIFNWFVFVACYLLLFQSSSIIWLESANWIAGTLVIVAVSSHDGCQWNQYMKTWTGMLIWIILIVMYFFMYFEGLPTYFGEHWQFEDEKIVVSGQSISLKATCLSSLFNLILFIGQQEFSVMIHKNKAAVLSIKPRVIWCKNAQAIKQQLLTDTV